MITYDRAPEIVDLIKEFGFCAVEVVMKNTHHSKLPELVITRRRMFAGGRDLNRCALRWAGELPVFTISESAKGIS